MKVCFFGAIHKGTMDLVLKKRLELQGVEIVECQEEIHSKLSWIIRAYVKLWWKHRKLNYDIMILTRWRDQWEMPFAKIISRKPIICPIYDSPYDIRITIWKKFKPNSFTAKFIHFWYSWTLKLSDIIIKESNAEIEYNAKEFGVDKKKFRRLFLSADEELFPVCHFKEPEEVFTILYFGGFNPHHSVDTIIESAKILSENKDIVFKFCGHSRTGKKPMEDLVKKYNLKNVKFLGFADRETLIDNIKKSDVCLGIFSDNELADRVVTNKVYEILCSQKPLITRYSKTNEETGLVNEKNCILVPPNDPNKLAGAIIFLKNNTELRKKIAESGRSTYMERLSIEKTSKELFEILNSI